MVSPDNIHTSRLVSKILMCLLMGMLVSCLGGRQLQVGNDYNYRGDFRKYKTFALMKPKLDSDTSLNNDEIRNAIASKMKFLGYEENSTSPHLIVLYKLFTDSARLPAYSQPGIRQLLQSSGDDRAYQGQRYFLELRPGTLLIQFFDTKLSQVVWQGYSTIPDDARNYNCWQVRRVVFSILDDYGVWASGFIDRRTKVITISKESNFQPAPIKTN